MSTRPKERVSPPHRSTLADIDGPTRRYLELVSGKKGAAALNAWMAFTGYPDGTERQIPESQRLAKAKSNATRYYAESALQRTA